jgi:hypothetical protein
MEIQKTAFIMFVYMHFLKIMLLYWGYIDIYKSSYSIA